MKKLASEMTEAERNLTEDWFDETRSGMTANEVIFKGEIEDAPPGPVKDELNVQKGRLLRASAKLDRAEEAFFTQGTKALNPPSDEDITETKRLTQALADRIIEEKVSQAVVKLVSDLSNFVSKVLA